MLENSFGVHFFLKMPKNQPGSTMRYVYVRITVDGTSKDISLKRGWDPKRWNQEKARATGTSEDARTLNSYLETISASIYAERTLCIAQRKPITAEYLRDFITGKSEDKKQLIEIFGNYNSKIEELVGKKYSYKTYQRYRTTYDLFSCYTGFAYDRCLQSTPEPDTNGYG